MTKKRALLISAPFIFFVTLVLTLNSFIFPKLTPFINKELNAYLAKFSPVQVDFKEIEILFFPAGIKVKTITVDSLDQMAPTLQPLTVQAIYAEIDVLQAVAGHFGLRRLVIDNLKGEIDLDPFLKVQSQAKELPIQDLLSVLNKVPLDRVEIENPSFYLNWREKKTRFKVTGHYVRASLEVRNQLSLRTHLLTQIEAAEQIHNLDLKSVIRLDENNLTIQSLDVNANGLSLEGKGLLSSFSRISIEPKADIFLKINVDLNKNHFILKNFISEKIQSLNGHINLQVQGLVSDIKHSTLDFQLNLENVEFNNYSIGSGQVTGALNNEKIKLSELSLNNSAGKAQLVQSELSLKKPYQFKSQLKIENIYGQKLFQNIDLKNIPVEFIATGTANCEGQISEFELECPISLKANDVRVSSSLKDGVEIIAIPELHGRGSIFFDTMEFRYSTQLSFVPFASGLEDSNFLNAPDRGLVSGEVNYKMGYSLDFKTSMLDLKKIKNLAHLDLEGRIQLDGSSRGDSKAASFESQTAVDNFYIKNYLLDQLKAQLQYKRGQLSLSAINGKLKQSPFTGDLKIDFATSSLSGAIGFESARVEDITPVFKRYFEVPLNVTGIGPVQAQFSGPLDFWKMNLKVQAHFLNGQVHHDSYDRFQISAHKEKETIYFDDVYIVKNRSRFSAKGQVIGPEPKWNLQFEAAQFRLEESELISSINSSLSGVFNSKAKLTGTLQKPELDVKSTVTESFIDEQSLPSSTADIQLNKTMIKGIANIFGNKIQSDFVIPLGESSNQPLKIRAQTVNWAFNDVLIIFGGASLKNQYTTELTANINLESPSGRFKDLNGNITIDQVLLQRGQQFLKNSKPIIMQVQNGIAHFIDFNLSGNENHIELVSNHFSPDNMNIEFNVQCSLSLLHIFIPVLDDLNGVVKMNATTRGPLNKPQILGQALIQNGFIKIPNFPHPIEKLEGVINFSQSKIILDKIRGSLGGGLIQSSGQVRIEGLRNLPMDINIKVENTTLNVPDRFKTSGDLSLKLSGHWFPFLISGQYLVTSAFIDKEFASNNGAVNLKQSIYLPKSIREQIIEPIILDLQILIQRNALIKNSLIDGGITGNLNIKGTPGIPQIIGEISFTKDSKFYSRETPFEIQTGIVKFSDPTEINPDIYITASSRVGEYDVSLLVQGTPKNINIQPSSVPPLSTQDIFTLLALGTTASNLDQATSGGVERRQTELAIGSALLSQTGIDKKVKENTGFDVQVGSYFDTTRNVSIPRVTVSKQIRKKLNASYSRTLGDQTQSEARLQYLINNNLSAIGSWQTQEVQDSSTSRFNGLEKEILGIDLEFKREFK